MKVFVGQPLVEPSTQELLAGHVVVTGAGSLPRAEWPLLTDADALLLTPRERITEEVLAAAPRVRIVASHSVGVDHVDLSACRARGILVTNTPDVLTDATAVCRPRGRLAEGPSAGGFTPPVRGRLVAAMPHCVHPKRGEESSCVPCCAIASGCQILRFAQDDEWRVRMTTGARRHWTHA